VAVEVDPRVTSVEHLEALAHISSNRLSFGVPDLDPTVQRLIGRNQTRTQTESLFDVARGLGF
jgi:oxygen-independent coproporphyrinogen-3 oxidase